MLFHFVKDAGDEVWGADDVCVAGEVVIQQLFAFQYQIDRADIVSRRLHRITGPVAQQRMQIYKAVRFARCIHVIARPPPVPGMKNMLQLGAEAPPALG